MSTPKKKGYYEVQIKNNASGKIRFKGIVKVKDYKINNPHECVIVSVQFTSSKVWSPGWGFYLDGECFLREVTIEKDPELFI